MVCRETFHGLSITECHFKDGDNFGLNDMMIGMGAENFNDMQTQAALAMFHDTPGGDQ